jgi:hypothetical protein
MTLVKLILGAPKMNPRPPKKIAKSNDDALAAFIARKAGIDASFSRIQSLSNDHFGVAPDEVTWGGVRSLGQYAELLRRSTDMAFHEGEHAA